MFNLSPQQENNLQVDDILWLLPTIEVPPIVQTLVAAFTGEIESLEEQHETDTADFEEMQEPFRGNE